MVDLYSGFKALDIRVGVIISVSNNLHARQPSFILEIDFGAELGVLKSSAQLKENYDIKMLIGRRILAVVNFPPRQIAKTISEVLVLATTDNNGENALLINPDAKAKLGDKLA